MNFQSLLLIFFCFSLFSCSNDESNETVDEITDVTESIIVDEENLTPCLYESLGITAGSKTTINCLIDLEGATINLPENVNFEFNQEDQGKIINGVLNFSGGTIDDELLNSQLTVTGDVKLSDPVFAFHPINWKNIVQGSTNMEQAMANKDELNKVIELSKNMGADTFVVDDFDAYFHGDFYTTAPEASFDDNSIKIPNDFHFKMSSNTFLRNYPSNNPAPRLIGIYKGYNITVSGGTLVGDKYTHDYSPVNDWLGVPRNNHANGSLLFIAGGDTVLVENVNMIEGTSDSIGIGGSTIRNPDGSLRENEITTTNIIIRGCTLRDCRRNGISVIDTEGLLIEGNTISDTGGPRDNPDANGANPQFGIDLEAYRERDENNQLIEYERVENVTIRENTFTGNFAGDIVIFTANNVLVEYNTLDNQMGANAAFNCKISNNTMIQREGGIETSIAIGFQELIINDEDLVYNNEISNNYIEGYDTSIGIGGLNMDVHDNILRDFDEGFFIRNLKESKIYKNNIESDRNISWGYITVNGNAKDVSVYDDLVNVNHKTVNFIGLNSSDLYSSPNITFDNVDFNSKGNRSLYLEDSSDITIKNSNITLGIENSNSTNVISTNNTIN